MTEREREKERKRENSSNGMINRKRMNDQLINDFANGNNERIFTSGTYCSGVLDNDPSVCAYKGICISSDYCVCYVDYTGTNCTIAECFLHFCG